MNPDALFYVIKFIKLIELDNWISEAYNNIIEDQY